ncbi:MAG: DNA repair protein RecO [Pseudomonadota bacterium]
MASVEKTQAFVLHVRSYRNTSALVDFFTHTQGVMRMVVNGLQGQSKKQCHWKGVLQPFQHISVSYRGKGGLKTLVDVNEQTATQRTVLQGSYLYCGFYLNELIQKSISQESVDAHLFDVYKQCIGLLSNKHDMDVCLRFFEAQLLQVLGYGVDLIHDASGHLIDPDAYYDYRPSDGFCIADVNDKRAILGVHLQALADNDLTLEYTRKVAKYVFRRAIETHLNVVELESRRLFVGP